MSSVIECPLNAITLSQRHGASRNFDMGMHISWVHGAKTTADKKTSAFTKLVYGSNSERAAIEDARKAILRADMFIYEQSLEFKEYNKSVEEHNKLIDAKGVVVKGSNDPTNIDARNDRPIEQRIRR